MQRKMYQVLHFVEMVFQASSQTRSRPLTHAHLPTCRLKSQDPRLPSSLPRVRI